MFSATSGIVSLVVLSAITGLVSKGAFPSPGKWVSGFVQGAVAGSQIGVMCAFLGVMTTALIMPGLGLKFSSAVTGWCRESAFLAVVFTGVVGLVIGMGLPTLAAYVIVSCLLVPTMVRLGIPVMAAHFVALYYAILSNVSPPVAVTSMVAARVADAPFVATALIATRLSAGLFVLPLFISFVPVLILEGSVGFGIISYLAMLIRFGGFTVALQGYCKTELGLSSRLLTAASNGAILAFPVFDNVILFGIGLSVLILLIVWQMTRKV